MSESTKRLSWECYRIPGISSPDKWRQFVERQLEADGSPYDFDIHGQAVRVWLRESPAVDVPRSNHKCRNAFRIQRVSFGGSRNDTLIGISIARVFFEDGISIPSFRSTVELFQKGRYPDALRHETMLSGIDGLIDYLRKSSDLTELEANRDFDCNDLCKSVVYATTGGSKSLQSLTRGNGLSRNLLQVVRSCKALKPASIRLGVLKNVSARTAKATEIVDQVTGVLQEWGCSVTGCDLADAEGVEQFIENGEFANVVLVPLDGKRGDRPPESALEWIRYLDSENAAFQLCSTSSNPMYSRHGLAMAVLSKAGGAHFATAPENSELYGNSWFIGLDLGRGGQREGRIAAITLTAPNGSLKAYWRALKDKTESLPLEVLAHGLRWIVDQAEILEQGRNYVLIRDGLCPRDENIDHYKAAMEPRPFTLIEFIKRGTPLIHQEFREPNPGTIVIPEHSPFTAIYACLSPQHGVLSSPAKFRTRINPNALSQCTIGEILTSLCHSATLSFQPAGVPSPLQWSNGLAKLSYSDLQFSGWAHLPHHTVDLR